MKNNILKLTYSSLISALIFLATAFLSFPVTITKEYIHLGDGFVLLAGIILGKRNGFLAAGIGSALADIYLGYAEYALPSFIIKGLMAFLVGYIFENLEDIKRLYIANLIVGIIFTIYVLSIKSIYDNSSYTHFDNISKTILMALAIPVMLLAISLLASKFKSLKIISTFLSSGLLMIVLYYVTTSVLLKNFFTPILSLPANLVQYSVGVFIATILYKPLLKIMSGSQLKASDNNRNMNNKKH